MDGSSSVLARIAGSAFAGAVGFVVGFYAGFFVVLSIWGLGTGAVAFVVFTGGLGTVAAGAGIAFTVQPERRRAALLTSGGLGVLMVTTMLAFDGDAGALAVGGLLVALLTAGLVRSGATDAMGG